MRKVFMGLAIVGMLSVIAGPASATAHQAALFKRYEASEHVYVFASATEAQIDEFGGLTCGRLSRYTPTHLHLAQVVAYERTVQRSLASSGLPHTFHVAAAIVSAAEVAYCPTYF